MNADSGGGTPRRRSRFRHDTAGESYPVSATAPPPSTATSREPVASRTTEEEARDLVALRRAKRGDDASFAALVSANDLAVRSLLAALCGAENLEALCLQTYLRAYRGLPVAPKSSPRLWLLGIADGVAGDEMRRRQRTREPAAGARTIPVPVGISDPRRLIVAAVHGAGLTSREAARLVPGGLDDVRSAITDVEGSLSLPFPPAPDHGELFWDDLGRQLLVERAAPAVATPTGEQPAITLDARGERAPGSDRAARGMALRIAQQNPRKFPWRAVGTVVLIVASVAAVLALALNVAKHASNHDAGLGETATKVLDKLDAALANDQVVKGVVTIESTDNATLPSGRYRFARSNLGSWSISAVDGTFAQGYDASSARMVTVTNTQGSSRAEVVDGLAPGPPETTATGDHVVGDLLAEAIRQVRGGVHGSVSTPTASGGSATTVKGGTTTTTQAPPPEWVVTASRPDLGSSDPGTLAGTGVLDRLRADRVRLIADQSLLLPRAVVLRRNTKLVATLRFSNFAISQQATGTPFVPEIPDGANVTRTDAGFEVSALGTLNPGGDSVVPTPSFLPSGFVVASVAVNRSTQVAVLCYRHGSRQLVLTHRLGRAATPTDPLSKGRTAGRSPRSVKISTGAFAGQLAYASSTPIPHVWASSGRETIIVAGDPDVDVLIKVVASLR